MRKKVLLFFILFAFILSGCSQQRYTVLVSDSGQVEFAFKISVDKDTFAVLDAYGVRTEEASSEEEGEEQKESFDAKEFEASKEKEESSNKKSAKKEKEKIHPLFEEYAKFYESRGFTVTPVSDATETGIELKKEYSSYDSFTKEIHEMYEQKEIGIKLTLVKEKNFYKQEYRIFGEMIFLTDEDFEKLRKDMEEVGSAIEPSRMKSTLYIRIPGEVFHINGTPERGGFVWEVSLADEKPVDIKYGTRIVDKQIIFFAITGAAIIGVAILLVLLIKLRGAWKRKKYSHLYDDDEEY